MIGSAWPGGRTLVTDTSPVGLDLDAGVGQRQATFRFELIDGVTGMRLGDITPIRGANLSHDTGQTTKRRLTMQLGKTDSAAVNPARDRVLLFMIIPGVRNPDRPDGDWPLGRYMWVDNPRRVFTSGRLARPQLSDEMFLVDQEIEKGISGVGRSVTSTILDVLEELPITFQIEPASFTSADSWGAGTRRGQILETLAVAGDFWSPWFDHEGVLQFRRTFDPAMQVPDLDLDYGFRVIRDSLEETDDLLTAPNTFVVVSNSATNPDAEVTASATVPVNAPNSVANRGFVITRTETLQVSDAAQAAAIARGLVRRQAIAETFTLATPPDPRHDSYNVIRWQGFNWLELAWSMDLVDGAEMVHVMRRAYT